MGKTVFLESVFFIILFVQTAFAGVPRFDDGIQHRFLNDEKLSQNIMDLTKRTVKRICGNNESPIMTTRLTFSADKKTAWVQIIIYGCGES